MLQTNSKFLVSVRFQFKQGEIPTLNSNKIWRQRLTQQINCQKEVMQLQQCI